MAKFNVCLKTVVTISCGEIEASTEEEALRKAEEAVDFDATVSKKGIVMKDGSYKLDPNGLDLVSHAEEHAYAILDELDEKGDYVEPEARLWMYEEGKGFGKVHRP